MIMSNPGPEKEAFFADLRTIGKAVGPEAFGNIVRTNTRTDGRTWKLFYLSARRVLAT